MARSQHTTQTRTGLGSDTITIDGWEGDIVEYALTNHFEGVDEILAAETEMINAQRKGTGLSALMAASGRGLEKMVKHLLTKDGVDLYLRDSSGHDAFDHALLFPNIIEILMRERLPNMKWQEPPIGPV